METTDNTNTYLDFSNVDGNMSNHFYLAYQSFATSRKINKLVKYIAGSSFEKFNLQVPFEYFGLLNTVCKMKDVKDGNVIQNTEHQISKYHQCMFIDYNVENIELFIRETFLKSSAYRNIEVPSDEKIAIHIRNKDYINSMFDCFDRRKYVESCLERIDQSISEIHVFSDDIEQSISEYDDVLKKRFETVVYENGSSIEDFRNMSLYKNKIIWNSTFSYWSAFIGNVINGNYEKTFAPSMFSIYEPVCNHVNPMWSIVNV